MMKAEVEKFLRSKGLAFRQVDLQQDTGFLLQQLPETGVSGISQESGLFLIAEHNMEALLASASPGASIAESGTLQLGNAKIAIHRYVRPGEPSGNIARRAAWFQKRAT